MEILQQIIEIDKAACARVEALREEKSRQLAESGKAAAQADEQRISAAKKELEEFRAAQQAALDKKKGGADAAMAEEIKRLDDIFAAHRDEWQSEIIEKVTGV